MKSLLFVLKKFRDRRGKIRKTRCGRQQPKKLEAWEQPKEYRLIDMLPRTAAGKKWTTGS